MLKATRILSTVFVALTLTACGKAEPTLSKEAQAQIEQLKEALPKATSDGESDRLLKRIEDIKQADLKKQESELAAKAETQKKIDAVLAMPVSVVTQDSRHDDAVSAHYNSLTPEQRKKIDAFDPTPAEQEKMASMSYGDAVKYILKK